MNQLVLSACISEAKPLRYTPAGTPAFDMRLDHESEVIEAGQARQVKASIKAVALGALAEVLGKCPMGSTGKFSGFLATPRHGKFVVFHVQEFQQD